MRDWERISKEDRERLISCLTCLNTLKGFFKTHFPLYKIEKLEIIHVIKLCCESATLQLFTFLEINPKTKADFVTFTSEPYAYRFRLQGNNVGLMIVRTSINTRT